MCVCLCGTGICRDMNGFCLSAKTLGGWVYVIVVLLSLADVPFLVIYQFFLVEIKGVVQ